MTKTYAQIKRLCDHMRDLGSTTRLKPWKVWYSSELWEDSPSPAPEELTAYARMKSLRKQIAKATGAADRKRVEHLRRQLVPLLLEHPRLFV
jgi:hypothetical protein